MADFSAWVEKNKALWTRVYDEVITPDFEEEWKKRDKKYEKELEQRDENQQILFTHINNEVVKNAHLVAENERLKRQIQEQHQVKAIAPGHESTITMVAREPTASEADFRQLTLKYDELNKKYHDVSQKVKYLERKNNAVMQKNKDMKESVRAWQEYADRQTGKQKLKGEARPEGGRSRLSPALHYQEDRPHVPSSPGSAATIRTPRSFAEIERSSPAPMLPLPRPSIESTYRKASPISNTGDEERSLSASVTPKAQGPDKSTEQRRAGLNDPGPGLSSNNKTVALNDERHVLEHVHQAIPSSSQTTEDEIAESANRHEQVITTGDDGDFPQFVSTRSLKRKRGQLSESRFEIFAGRSSDGTPAKPFRVKEEQLSSPPTTTYKLARNETIDLDDPAAIILQTPRHPRRQPSVHSKTTGTFRQQRSNSAPFTQMIKPERKEAEDPTVTGLTYLPQVSPAEVRAFSEPSDPTQPEEAILRSLDPNILGSASEEPLNKRLRHAEARRKGGHSMLAESGEEHPPMDENELRLPPRLARAHFNRRLNPSTNPQTPAKGRNQTPRTASAKVKLEQVLTPPYSSSRSIHMNSGGKGSRSVLSKSRSKPRDDPTLDDRQIWTLKTPETRLSARNERGSLTAQGRLRDKPIAELTVKDFKPNPTYNQGYSYAFSETVRKRGDRMCLPGCTNPQCCGSTFRVMAEAQAPLTASQEEALLDDYLGEAYNNMQLTQMSSEERKELVLQARTKKMAKETGKHREAYERRRTPPGFWRVDFPTTQEQQEDRDRAKEQEKLLVHERWLEAHKKGGKWIFRDQV